MLATDIPKRKIKIAHIITRLDWAGAPDIIRIICSYPEAKRFDIKLITGPTRYATPKTKKFLEEFKDKIIVVPWLRRKINPFFDTLALLNLYFILAGGEFDIVHTHTAKAGVLGRLAAYLAGYRRIIHMPHGHNFYGYFNSLMSKSIVLIEKFLAKFTTQFVALSELEKKELVEFGVARKEKVRVIPSGMDLEFKNINHNNAGNRKKEFGFGVNQKIIGMVSRLEPVKGSAYFIEAAKMILREIDNVGFIVVGEGSLRNKLEDRVKESGLNNKIIFTGWRDDVLEIISFLDILVQPSLNEAIGRVLIEAQGLGIPVIATRVGGIPEIVKDNITGILVSSGDTQELSMAICNLLRDEERRLSMSARAKEWVDEKFSAERMAEEINSLFMEIMAI